MNKSLILVILFIGIACTNSYGQFPYEKYPAIKYKEYSSWKEVDTVKTSDFPSRYIEVPTFFDKGESLGIKLTTYSGQSDSSFISIYKAGKLLQRKFEPMDFYYFDDPLYIADINGDGWNDIKLIVYYGGNGLAALNVKVIYLFQSSSQTFEKISYTDMMGGDYLGDYRLERDLNGDKNFEIITMDLQGYQNHNYWTFNIYNYVKGTLINVNDKYNYPIMIQHLYRDNYKITDKISRKTMKQFSLPLPFGFDRR